MQISVVIPAYNESERIEGTIRKVHSYLSNNGYDFEIIVVDDGSSDDTLQKVASAITILDKTDVIHYDINKGYGFAVKKGMLSARKEFALFLDADLAAPIEELEKCVEWLNKGYDIVISSRRMESSNIIKKMPPIRESLGKGYIVLGNLLLGTHISDFNCGFKMFKREAYGDIFPKQRLNRWGFSCEIIFIAIKSGFTIKEIPIKYIHREESKVKIISDMVFSFIELLSIRFNWLIGEYRVKRNVEI